MRASGSGNFRLRLSTRSSRRSWGRRLLIVAAYGGFLLYAAACLSVWVFLPGVIWHWGMWAVKGMQGWLIFVTVTVVIGLPLAARDPEYWKRRGRH